MSIFSKILQTMRLTNDDDDYYLDDDDEDYEEEKPQRRSFFRKKEQAYDEEPYDDDYDYDEPEEPAKSTRFLSNKSNPKVVAMKKPPQMQVSMVKPTSIDDAESISDYLLEGRAVLINMEGIHTEVAQRIVDFSSGAAYSMQGNLQKITNYIFIATPKSVELSGDFQGMLSGNSGLDVSGLNIRM